MAEESVEGLHEKELATENSEAEIEESTEEGLKAEQERGMDSQDLEAPEKKSFLDELSEIKKGTAE